jgi:outer membrane protein W
MNIQSQTTRYGAAALIIAALGVCGLPQAQAADTPASVRGGHFYAFGGFAALAADTNGQFQNEKGSPANLIFGGGYGVTPNLAVELALLFSGRKLDTPAQVQQQLGGPLAYAGGTDKTTMGAFGPSVALKYIFVTGDFAPYVGAGAGLYTTTFLTRTDAIGCSNNCSGTGPRVSDHSTDIGAHVLVGADIHFTPKNILAIDLRYLKLRADLSDINLGKVDSGGTFFWMGYRRIF